MRRTQQDAQKLCQSATELFREGDLTSALVRVIQAEHLFQSGTLPLDVLATHSLERARRLRIQIIRVLKDPPSTEQAQFSWSDRGILFDERGRTLFTFRKGCLPYLFLKALARGPARIEDLTRSLAQNIRGKQDLYILVSRLNRKVPHLIENKGGYYRLAHRPSST